MLLLKETAFELGGREKKVRRTSASLQNRVSWEKIPLCFTARIWGTIKGLSPMQDHICRDRRHWGRRQGISHLQGYRPDKIQRLPGRIYGEGFLHGSAGAGAGRKKGCEGWTVLCADRKSVYQEIFGISQSESCAGSFITGETADFKGLGRLAEKNKMITKATE